MLLLSLEEESGWDEAGWDEAGWDEDGVTVPPEEHAPNDKANAENAIDNNLNLSIIKCLLGIYSNCTKKTSFISKGVDNFQHQYNDKAFYIKGWLFI